MERVQDIADELIDLGVASVETKGQVEGGIEPGALFDQTGLSDN